MGVKFENTYYKWVKMRENRRKFIQTLEEIRENGEKFIKLLKLEEKKKKWDNMGMGEYLFELGEIERKLEIYSKLGENRKKWEEIC